MFFFGFEQNYYLLKIITNFLIKNFKKNSKKLKLKKEKILSKND